VLREVVLRGTGQLASSILYETAGKTATGYIHDPGEQDEAGKANLAAFIGFAPMETPRVVILAIVENPHDSGGAHGATHAAPLFREVAERTLQYLNVAPQKR